ncbi:MAG: ABC transporter ATP-binding protein, partial [Candidatus Thermoplasmatota archaeon]|nr:ABC transporter ATP-binding protein [Candidatus Thermoplasmatota archaeon]
RDMIRDMKGEGKTILLTTHYMFEADELCQRIAVISKGSIVALDRPSELKKQVKDVTLVELQVYGATEDFLNRIRGMEGVSKVYSDFEGDKQMIRIQTPIGGELIPDIRKLSEDFRTKIIETNVREPTLEDAYLRMVEE